MKAIALFVAVGLVVLGCSKPASEGDSGPGADEKAQYAKEDAADFGAGKEAKVWLADPNHVFFKASKETVAGLVRDIYAAGADEIRVGKLDKLEDTGNKEFGGDLVVKLPGDAAKRKTMFTAMNKFWAEAGDDPTKDEGQQYASFTLD